MGNKYILHNHQTSSLSELDMRMVRSVPAGGNWQDIPLDVPSKRLDRIRETGGRTTYYGRLRWDKPSYTINTYFNRPGNGCNIHPDDGSNGVPAQHRLLSFREAARIQSFPDDFIFYGSNSSIYKQIGNAVPPLLAYAIAKELKAKSAVDLFCGCGGLSYGFHLAGTKIVSGVDCEKHFIETWRSNHPDGEAILGDITTDDTKNSLYKSVKDKLGTGTVDAVIGGPPCQGFSTAGWRMEDDPRNRLWKHYLEVVKNLSPKFFIMENVPGLLSASNSGQKVIAFMREAFGEIGYSITYKKLNAEDYGVPQLRRRIIIVGTRHGSEFKFPDPICSTPVSVKDAIWGLPTLSSKDGQREIILEGFKPEGVYQKWLAGIVPVDELIQRLKKEKSGNLKEVGQPNLL